jgi:hypothetical protein
MGKSSSNGALPIAVLVYRRLTLEINLDAGLQLISAALRLFGTMVQPWMVQSWTIDGIIENLFHPFGMMISSYYIGLYSK